jgi:hypothetical protein
MSDASSTPAPRSKRRKILLTIVAVLLAGMAVFAGVVASQPDDYRVSRSILISAPAEAVFDEVDDLHRWNDWSPWIELDPSAKISFAGPERGKGAEFRWDGNAKMGAGSMTILDSRPPESVQMKLAFTRPMEDSSLVDFAFQPAGEQTQVTWTMSGRHPNFIGKACCFVMNMDKMIGGDFERGLANLKRAVEGG